MKVQENDRNNKKEICFAGDKLHGKHFFQEEKRRAHLRVLSVATLHASLGKGGMLG